MLSELSKSVFSKKWSIYWFLIAEIYFFSDFPNKFLLFLFCAQKTPLRIFSSPRHCQTLILLFRHQYVGVKPTDEKQFPPKVSWWKSQWTHKNPQWEALWKLTRHYTLSSRSSENKSTHEECPSAFLPASFSGVKGILPPSPLKTKWKAARKLWQSKLEMHRSENSGSFN